MAEGETEKKKKTRGTKNQTIKKKGKRDIRKREKRKKKEEDDIYLFKNS